MSNTDKVFVSVYRTSQVYGGPEEGGWYYPSGEPVDGVFTVCCGKEFSHDDSCPAYAAMRKYEAEYVKGSKDEWADSFISTPSGGSWLDSMEDAPEPYGGEIVQGGRHEVRIEREPPASYPECRPYYE